MCCSSTTCHHRRQCLSCMCDNCCGCYPCSCCSWVGRCGATQGCGCTHRIGCWVGGVRCGCGCVMGGGGGRCGSACADACFAADTCVVGGEGGAALGVMLAGYTILETSHLCVYMLVCMHMYCKHIDVCLFTENNKEFIMRGKRKKTHIESIPQHAVNTQSTHPTCNHHTTPHTNTTASSTAVCRCERMPNAAAMHGSSGMSMQPSSPPQPHMPDSSWCKFTYSVCVCVLGVGCWWCVGMYQHHLHNNTHQTNTPNKHSLIQPHSRTRKHWLGLYTAKQNVSWNVGVLPLCVVL